MLNRTEAPAFKEIENIILPEPMGVILDNNIMLYVINQGTQDLVKIEFIFNAGKWNEPSNGIASATNSLLTEGTRHHTGKEIAEKIDYYGAFIETDINGDNGSLVIYSLTKHLESILPLIKEILAEATFPENELRIYAQNQQQKLIINNGKVDYLARKHFNEQLYGFAHPYGRYINPEEYDHLKTEDIRHFFNQYYKTEDCKIIVSGKVDDKITKLINHYFGFNDWNKTEDFGQKSFNAHPSEEKQRFIRKEGAVQSAIRIGKRMFTRRHPDYIPMQILNTLLGGYFGSRLMANIREDKGYTYGIGSAIGSHQHEGYFLIATEVGVKVCNQALEEIYKELEILKNDPVGKEELMVVKNYMLGSFLRGIDGPFEQSEKLKNVLLHGLDNSYYQKYIHTIKEITSLQLQELANKYLQRESFYELVAGER